MRMSIAIPYHGNRLEWTMKTVRNCHNMATVGEIVLSVEPDTSVKELREAFINFKKVKIFTNLNQLFVFRNKIAAVQRCSSEWVALIDSDNVINCQYTDSFIREKTKNEQIIYAPSKGFPQLDYTQFVGEDISGKRASELVDLSAFEMLRNTMNYIIHRETWLNALKDAIVSDYEPRTADSSWINYNCWKAGMVMRVIDNMVYTHTMHPLNAPKEIQSTYRLYSEEGVRENKKIRQLIKELNNENGDSAKSVHAGAERQIPFASNWTATGGQGGTVVQKEHHDSDKKVLLTD